MRFCDPQPAVKFDSKNVRLSVETLDFTETLRLKLNSNIYAGLDGNLDQLQLKWPKAELAARKDSLVVTGSNV